MSLSTGTIAIACVFLLAPGLISGQEAGNPKPKADPPQIKVRLIQDEAKLFDKETIDETNAIVAKIHTTHRKDLFIETIAESPDKEKRTEWARERFNALGIDGIYIVIGKKPAFFRYWVGDRTAMTHFKQDNIRELENILKRKNPEGTMQIKQAATYVLETMNLHAGPTFAKLKIDPFKLQVRFIQDEAKLFSKETLDQTNALVAKIHDRHYQNLVIETSEKDPDITSARGPFNALAVDGVYIVMSKKTGAFRVVVSRGASTPFAGRHVEDLERILSSEEPAETKLQKAATFVLAKMTENGEPALRNPRLLDGRWFGPEVAVKVNAKGDMVKARLFLDLRLPPAGKGQVQIGHTRLILKQLNIEKSIEAAIGPFPLELRDDVKLGIAIKSGDKTDGDLELTYRFSKGILTLSAPRAIHIPGVAEKVDLSGPWKSSQR